MAREPRDSLDDKISVRVTVRTAVILAVIMRNDLAEVQRRQRIGQQYGLSLESLAAYDSCLAALNEAAPAFEKAQAAWLKRGPRKVRR